MEAEKLEKRKSSRRKSVVNVKKDSKSTKSKNYSEENVREALKKIFNEKWTVYKASKAYKVPWSTLKGRVVGIDQKQPLDDKVIPTVKVGRPFNLTETEEKKVIAYIQRLQSMGFDINCNEVRKYAYNLSADKEKNFFSEKTSIAGWSWWVSFKNRYERILNLQDYFSVIRDSDNLKNNLKDFYSILKKQFEVIGGSLENLWNLGTTTYNLSTSVDQKHKLVHFFTTISAAGQRGPSQLWFRGKKPIVNPQENLLPPNFTLEEDRGYPQSFSRKLSQFLHCFISFKGGPMIILMDSQNQPISPQILEVIDQNHVILLPFPARTNTILHPLNIKIFKPLKQSYRKKVFEMTQGGITVKKIDFLNNFMPLFNKIAITENILAGFKDAGIFPLDEKVTFDNFSLSNDCFGRIKNLNLKNLLYCNICGENEDNYGGDNPNWIKCTQCKNTYHLICVDVVEFFPNFLCPECTNFSDCDTE